MTKLKPVVSVVTALMLTVMPVKAETTQPSIIPDIDLQTLDGERLLLSETNNRFRVVNFWATWCPPCVKEMPALANLDAELESVDGEVIAINVGESAVQVEAFLLEHLDPGGMRILLDSEGKSFPVFKLSALPMTIIVSPSGEVLDYAVGGREWDAPVMVEAIKKLATN